MDTLCAPLAFIDGLGAPEMMLIFVLVLLLFGGKKLPEFARGLGKTMREFKKAASGVEEEFKRALDEDERKQNQLKLAEAPTTPAPSSPPDTNAGPDPYHDNYTDYSHEHDYQDQATKPTAESPAPDAAVVDPTVAPASPEAAPPAPTETAGPTSAAPVTPPAPSAPEQPKLP